MVEILSQEKMLAGRALASLMSLQLLATAADLHQVQASSASHESASE